MEKQYEKDFLVLEWTPVYLDWKLVLSSSDFIVSFSWKELGLIELIKYNSSKILFGEEDIYFPISTEHWDIYIDARDLLTKQ